MPGNGQRRFSGSRTLRYIGVAVLTVAAVGLAGFALMHKSSADLSEAAATYTPPSLPGETDAPMPTSSAVASAQAGSTPTPTATAASTPNVVFIGDGYTASGGASDAAHGFPALVGKAEHWNVTVVACSGAGYVTTGTCGSDYAGLIPKVAADTPSIVVVTGGRNDTPQYQSAQAANSFYTQLAAALPSAKIYAISPVWDNTQGQMPLGVVQSSVQAAASAHSATYVDIGEPLKGHPEDISSA